MAYSIRLNNWSGSLGIGEEVDDVHGTTIKVLQIISVHFDMGDLYVTVLGVETSKLGDTE